jgi:hypothetical protein
MFIRCGVQTQKHISDWTTRQLKVYGASEFLEPTDLKTWLQLEDIGGSSISMFAECCNSTERYFISTEVSRSIQALHEHQSDFATLCGQMVKVRRLKSAQEIAHNHALIHRQTF